MIDHDSRTLKRSVALGLLSDSPKLYQEPLRRSLLAMEAEGLIERVEINGRMMLRITPAGVAELERLAKGE